MDAKPAPLPKGLGTALIAGLGLAAGPGLGRLMDRLRDEVERGNIEAQREHAHYLDHIRRNPELLERLVGKVEAE